MNIHEGWNLSKLLKSGSTWAILSDCADCTVKRFFRGWTNLFQVAWRHLFHRRLFGGFGLWYIKAYLFNPIVVTSINFLFSPPKKIFFFGGKKRKKNAPRLEFFIDKKVVNSELTLLKVEDLSSKTPFFIGPFPSVFCSMVPGTLEQRNEQLEGINGWIRKAAMEFFFLCGQSPRWFRRQRIMDLLKMIWRWQWSNFHLWGIGL